ncbi:hypothetical protein NLU13_7730 [Sarocladium strictum]|uniref:Uncharacterized protein n=1 Tax=Sarocladium strictum TaxID=5046 RepID=A0AA39GEU4_SARSR|nr:hypothetical protein NLU13_7730 [Sarocladium strictum]
MQPPPGDDSPHDTIANTLSLAACVLPILSFPFLPSRVPISPFTETPPSSKRQMLGPIYCLFYTSLIGIILFWYIWYFLQCLLVSDSTSPGKVVNPSKLVTYIAHAGLTVSIPPLVKWDVWNVWNTRIGYREPVPEDFIVPAGLSCAPPWVEFSKRFIVPYVGSWWNDYMIDAIVAAVLAIPVRVPVTKLLCQIARRDVSWWFWLKRNQGIKDKSEDGPEVEDDPWWSWVVYRVVIFLTPLLWLGALIRVVYLVIS